MRRPLIHSVMAMGLVLLIGGGIQAGHGGSGHGGSSHGGSGSHGNRDGSSLSKTGQRGTMKTKGGQVYKNGQPRTKPGQTKSTKASLRVNAPRRVNGVRPHWHRYWNARYGRYMYIDPDCDCTYFQDEQDGYYYMLAEEED